MGIPLSGVVDICSRYCNVAGLGSDTSAASGSVFAVNASRVYSALDQ